MRKCHFLFIILVLVVVSCEKEDDKKAPTSPTQFLPPSNLTAEALSPNLVSLTWSDNSDDEDGFIIERAVWDGPYSMSIPVSPNTNRYLDSNLVLERTRYRYRVFAVRSGERSFPSNEAVVITPIRPPNTPTLLRVEALSATSVRITWQDNSTDESGFKVWRALGVQDIFRVVVQVAENSGEFVDTNLTEYTRCRYKVVAVKDTVESMASQVGETTTPPQPPSELLVETWSDSSLRLGWRDNSLVESGFCIERLNSAGDAWIEIGQTSANITFLVDEGLLEWTRYHYRVKTIASNLRSVPCASAWGLTGLKAPANLEAVRTSETSIRLNWQDRSGVEDGYEIERKDVLNPEFQRVYVTVPNASSFTDIGLTTNMTYTYRVRTVKEGNVSGWSNEAKATTSYLRPPAPTGLQAFSTNSLEITLNWTRNSTNELGFIIEWKRWDGVNWNIADTVSAGVVIYRAIMQDWRTRYQFRVYAYNEYGRSDYSNVAEATTPDGSPQSPSELQGTVQGYELVTLNWRDNSTNETEFSLERAIGDSGNWNVYTVLPANTAQYIDRDVMPLGVYLYRVAAVNQYGASGYSNIYRAFIPDAAPTPPSDLRGSALNYRSALLMWRDNSNDEMGFTLERRTLPAGQWSKLRDVQANDTTYIDTTLTETTTYLYRIQAFNWVRENIYRSAWSNELVVITPRDTVLAPSNLTATVDGFEVLLNWRDNSNNETRFLVERSPWEQGHPPEFTVIDTVPRDCISYGDIAAMANRIYGYRVKAQSENRESAYSNIAWAQIETTVLFYDGFEDYEVGQPPAGEWQDTAIGTSWVRVTEELSNPEGGKSVQFHDLDDGLNYCILTLYHQPLAMGVVKFFLRLSDRGCFGVSGLDQNENQTFYIILRDDGNIYVYNGENMVNCRGYNLNEWMEFELYFRIDTHQFRFYINGQGAGSYRILRGESQENRGIRFITFPDATLPDAWIDEVELDTLIWRL